MPLNTQAVPARPAPMAGQAARLAVSPVRLNARDPPPLVAPRQPRPTWHRRGTLDESPLAYSEWSRSRALAPGAPAPMSCVHALPRPTPARVRVRASARVLCARKR